MAEADHEGFLFHRLLADEGLHAESDIVVMECAHHDVLEVIVGIAVVDFLEGFNFGVGVDVDSDGMSGA
jgi:hypothetical protein